MENITLLVDIKRNALDDGPGIRTLIFFKGCPLSCVWCQNPEAKSPNKELSFNKNICRECFACIEECNQNAIDLSYEFRIDRTKCNLCGRCIEVCPNSALKFVGQEYRIKDLVNIILKDRIFFQNSGGGVTLSGGEPLYHINYVKDLVKELKKEAIHICIETCGYYNREKFYELILPYLDLIYFDLKIFDSELHRKYCNVSNERILANFEDLIKKKSIKIVPRIPLIPKITDTQDNLSKLADYLKKLNVRKIILLSYNPLWISKSLMIGITPKYDYSEFLDKKNKERIKLIFSDFEINDF
ncbi:MAG: glycyl-radical enzyme activating protein [Candidatus Lokiarchaeota archaeon]|nr:glycyl-radical enzyme activating protein [Candidatus Lokiarchaeota archaeon]